MELILTRQELWNMDSKLCNSNVYSNLQNGKNMEKNINSMVEINNQLSAMDENITEKLFSNDDFSIWGITRSHREPGQDCMGADEAEQFRVSLFSHREIQLTRNSTFTQ
ncbi:hypothetical protein HZH66_013381 [Vespula vulgaris]|uniref:Uncharacterized protein n=1 Tax=Vespula vulgaris TaxID=7454 RepID=A0A834J9L8_VESVU|nr:hypothetical protein HZH66_013381 [Vespula vulgaris]